MKRILLGIAVILLMSFAVNAQTKELPDAPTPKVAAESKLGPAHTNPYAVKDPYWNDHKIWTPHALVMEGLMFGGSYANYKGGDICRHNNGVEPCTAHYGAFYQTVTFDAIISISAGTAVYHMCRKDTHNSKWCDIIPSTVIGLNTGWGIHEALINKPEKEK
jgi:hypothetical protein